MTNRLFPVFQRAIGQLRRPGKSPTAAGRRGTTVEQRLENVERRLGHLEAMIEGLQDAVHRESVRQEQEIHELQRKAEPSEIRRALGQDAREHGI